MDTYYKSKTIKDGNFTVNIYVPIITEEERNRRMKLIHDAAAELIKGSVKCNTKNL